jgi:AcrR family transcriptional regulator
MSNQVSNLPRRGVRPQQAETVERLLVAGAEELRQVGHDALTMRTVAARAGVATATAYTYLSSKNHLFAELFWRVLSTDDVAEPVGDTAVERLRDVTRHLAEMLDGEPELAAAVTTSLLSSDPDVARLRLRIGGHFLDRFRQALGPDADPVLVETLALAFSGSLLQAGMGLMTYAEMGKRLDAVVAVIMKGNE